MGPQRVYVCGIEDGVTLGGSPWALVYKGARAGDTVAGACWEAVLCVLWG